MPVIDHSVFTGRMPFDYYYYNHFYGSLDFVRHNPGELVPGETFTHWHLSFSSIIPYLLPPSFMIHGILLVQFTCLAVFFHNFCLKFSFIYLLAWHPPLHTPYISSPNHCLLFAAHAHTLMWCCSTEIMSSNPSLSLNPLLGTLLVRALCWALSDPYYQSRCLSVVLSGVLAHSSTSGWPIWMKLGS